MSQKAPSVIRPSETRPNQTSYRKAMAIYKAHEAFTRDNDMLDESGTPSPSETLIAERCAVLRSVHDALRWEGSKLLVCDGEEELGED